MALRFNPTGVKFRDNRGRFRTPERWESNQFFTVDTLSKGLAQFRVKTEDAMAEAMLDFAVEMLQYAKANAPWQDRTGDARQGLDAEVYAEPNEMGIILAHTVSYGIWLEIRWGGKYAIIMPTVETMGPRLYAKMRGMMSRIIYYV